MKFGNHKGISFIVILSFILTMMPLIPAMSIHASAAGWDGTTASTQLSGSGISGDPYLIQSAEDLAYMRDQVNAKGTVSGDAITTAATAYYQITASALIALNAAEWVPIGTGPATCFEGNFDGNGSTISGLTISKAALDYQGLFGYVSGASIRDLSLTGVSVSGMNYVGGLAGYAVNSTVSGIKVSGTVAGKNYVGGLLGNAETNTVVNASFADVEIIASGNFVGGLVGNTSYTIIESSYASGAVSGSGYSYGGLIGDAVSSQITSCWAIGSVSSARFNIGGLIGEAVSCHINDSYETGSVNGASAIGGLVGYAWSNSTITSSYAIGNVSGSSIVGGLVGNNLSGTMSGCFWDTITSGTTSAVGSGSSSGAMGLATASMQSKPAFESAGWNFVSTWQLVSSAIYKYPVFQWQILALEPPTEGINPPGDNTGGGSHSSHRFVDPRTIVQIIIDNKF